MSTTVQMRVRLPAEVEARFGAMSPALRSRAIAAVLVGASDGIDLAALIEATDQLRRLGVLFNQSLRLAHTGGGIDVATEARIMEALALIDRLRGQS